MTLDGLSVSSRLNGNGKSADVETQETLDADVEMSGETLDEESTLSASVQGVSQDLEEATLDGDTQVEVCRPIS